MNNENTVGYKGFINVIKRGKWIILLLTLLATLAATGVSYHSMKSSKPTYQTITSVVIGNRADILDAVKLSPTFEQIANSSIISKNACVALKGAIPIVELQKSYEVVASADAPILTITTSGETQLQSTVISNAVITSFSREVKTLYPTETVKVMENSTQNNVTHNKFQFINVVAAFLLGLFLSIFIVTFIGFFDEKIRSKDDVEKYSEIPVIGNSSKIKHVKNLDLNLNSSEAFYELKSNIQFLFGDIEKKVIMVSSAEKNEGRSTTATYLSLALAGSGKKTILVDCDLKNPNIHNIFDLSNDKGLVNYLLGDTKDEEVIRTTKQKNLSILTSGSKTLNYAELFVSSNFNEFIQSLKKDFDYIIIDTPALLEGADAIAISKHADGSVLVVKAGQTERKTVIKAKEILQKANANIIGAFLNKTR